VTIISSIEAQASVQVTTSSIDDDIYSIVSDDDSIGLQSSRPDNQSSHALPYEVAVFEGQSLSDSIQILQHKIDSKTAAALQPYDEADYSNHNEQHRDGQTCTQVSDEHHMYEEVTHEAKGQSKPIVSVVSETREGNDKEATTASELFDDMVYDVTFHVKSTTNMGEDHTAEPTATKKRKDQPRFDDEHVYDSANQLSKGQIAAPLKTNGDNDNTNRKAGGTTHIYHSLEQSENEKFSNPESHSIPIGHHGTIVQETKTDMPHEQPQYNTLQHGGVTQCGLRFDDAYDQIKVHMSKDANNGSTFIKQIPKISHGTVSYYDRVENLDKRDRTSQMVPQIYEQVYHGPNSMQIHKPTGKQLGFNDETYEAAIQQGVNRVKSTPHSETVTVKDEITNKGVQYAEPMAPDNKSHIRVVQAEGEHFYHSLELNEPMNPEKCVSGDLYSKECSNPVVMKERTFGSNNYLTSKSKSSKLATLPKKDQFTADTKCQAHTFTSLYDTCSDNTMGEAGATNDPILFNLKFDDSMYEGIPHSVPKRKSNPSSSIIP
jgi:hypothetical protein